MGKFRVQRKKFGLTYSAPRDTEENPTSAESIKEHLDKVGGTGDWLIGTEYHKNGKKHFHANVTFSEVVNSYNERLFDVDGVHPEINKPGKGWESYCAKHGEYITNYYEAGAFVEASKKRTWTEASDLLWAKEPRWMLQHASGAEKNFAKRIKGNGAPSIFFGPCRGWVPIQWDPKVHALCAWGEPRIGKTHEILNDLMGRGLSIFVVKGSLAKMRYYAGQDVIVFDDTEFKEDLSVQAWNALTDVLGGGSVSVSPTGLYDYEFPPGVGRVFIDNHERVFNDPHGAIEARVLRVEMKLPVEV